MLTQIFVEHGIRSIRKVTRHGALAKRLCCVAGTPVFCQSKLHTMIALLMPESKLIALPKATRYIKSIFYLIKELHKKGWVAMQTPRIFG
jgi:hypothetical protein